uniref:Uncharacterized protein n=1 Tax=Anopheles funestus TaxID=62324 RepID=A0A182RH00_ANOFN
MSPPPVDPRRKHLPPPEPLPKGHRVLEKTSRIIAHHDRVHRHHPSSAQDVHKHLIPIVLCHRQSAPNIQANRLAVCQHRTKHGQRRCVHRNSR